MSEFFSKFKSRVKNTGTAVKKVVDTNQSRFKAGRKRAEIEAEFSILGKNIFDHYRDNGTNGMEAIVMKHSRKIEDLQNALQEYEARIKRKKSKKKCPCGEVVPPDVKYCPSCGFKF